MSGTNVFFSGVTDFFTVIWNIILSLSVSDVFDLALVAYLIHRILTVVRRTSAASVIKGVIFLIAVVWLSSLLKLTMTSFLLSETMKMGVFIILILFQPELRKFLEQFGSRNWSLLFKPRQREELTEASINYTVKACFDMSKARTGALIVFEREVGLADYVSTGTRIDSLVSVELLVNIFYPNTPLHDGAVIIKEGRIISAGCMLPMSNNTNISRELGMRHRAGIGISERSDALAVIVSEETGSVSVAVDGMLKRHLARDTFEKLLRNELLTSEDAQESKQKTLRRQKEKK